MKIYQKLRILWTSYSYFFSLERHHWKNESENKVVKTEWRSKRKKEMRSKGYIGVESEEEEGVVWRRRRDDATVRSSELGNEDILAFILLLYHFLILRAYIQTFQNFLSLSACVACVLIVFYFIFIFMVINLFSFSGKPLRKFISRREKHIKVHIRLWIIDTI